MKSIRRIGVVATCFAMCLSALLTCAPIADAQKGREPGDGQALVGAMVYPSEFTVPIEITTAKVRGREVKFGKAFDSEESWLRNLKVTVKNVSERDIVGVVLRVEFPYDAAEHPWLPEVALRAGSDYSLSRELYSDWILRPGESADVTISKETYAIHLDAVRAKADLPAHVTRRANIKPEVVAFGADNIWLRGQLMVRDADRWVVDEVSREGRAAKQRFDGVPRFRKVALSLSTSPLPGCYTTQSSSSVVCNVGNCTTCTAVQDDFRDAETGKRWKLVNQQCRKVVGGHVVDCPGCTMNLHVIDPFSSC